MILVGPKHRLKVDDNFLLVLECPICGMGWGQGGLGLELGVGHEEADWHFTPRCVRCGETWSLHVVYRDGFIKLEQMERLNEGVISNRMDLLFGGDDD